MQLLPRFSNFIRLSSPAARIDHCSLYFRDTNPIADFQLSGYQQLCPFHYSKTLLLPMARRFTSRWVCLLPIDRPQISYPDLGLFINNEFVKSKSGETLTTINPT